MPFDPNEIACHLVCPDDASPLVAATNALRCTNCNRAFPFLSPNLLDLLPSKALDLPTVGVSTEYAAAYLQTFKAAHENEIAANNKTEFGNCDDADRDDATQIPFNAPETSSPTLVQLRERQSAEVLQLLQTTNTPGANSEKSSDIVFCDLSAASGYTTFAAARHASIVFHCDLSPAAVRYASTKAIRLGLDNIVVVRADYLQPPFRNSIDQLTCIDTLIRGPWHESRLLAAIRRSLSRRGVAVVDFHNWWHNPFRRLGLLPQNFGQNHSYAKREVLDLLARADIENFTISPFIAEARPHTFVGEIVRAVLPATRFMIRFTSSGSREPR